jgi:hypothetical protein
MYILIKSTDSNYIFLCTGKMTRGVSANSNMEHSSLIYNPSNDWTYDKHAYQNTWK